MSDYEPKCKKTLPIIFDDRMPGSNLTPKLVGRVNDNTEDLKNLYEDEITHLKQDINELETTKADASGTSENLTAGNAEQLLTDKGMTDKVPYLLRASGGSGADREEDKIVGGTVAWNQLVIPRNNSASSADKSVTIADGVVTVVSTGQTAAVSSTSIDWINLTQGHKYLIAQTVPVDGTGIKIYFDGYSNTGGAANILLAYSAESAMKTLYVYVSAACPTGTYTLYPNVFDLTQMFGTAIADRAYAMEQSTAGSGIAWLKSMGFFTKDYYPYDAGTLKSVEGLTAHSMVGFNQFDKTSVENGKWVDDYTTGAIASTTTAYNVTGFIPVVPNTSYYKSENGSSRNIFYDANKNVIPLTSWSIGNAPTRFTSPANAAYIRFTVTNSHLDDFCFNLAWDNSRNGEYEPYVKHSYPLDSTLTLRGIPKLDSNNQLYYDGDTYESDGTVKRRYGVVDLGTLTWFYNEQFNMFFRSLTDGSFNQNNIICAIYTTFNSWSDLTSDTTRNGIFKSTDSSHSIYIRNTAYSDPAVFKTAMSGVYLVYELATETTEEAEPFQNPQIVDPYGTESYETTGIVPVGHSTFYPENLRSKIEGLPFNFATLIAPTESTYKATRAYSANNLFIVNNILYKATTSIASGGTITPGTNCTATTLAEIIAALS